MKLIFLDIETTNEHLDFNIDESELIEVWAYNPENNKSFSEFCNIPHQLSEFTKRLTHISDNDLKWAKNPQDVLNWLKKFIWDINDCILVWHNIEWFDLPVLSKYDSDFKNIKYLDTLQLFQLLYPWLEQYNVEYLYRYFFSDDYIEKHRALDDAKDEFKLFNKFLTPDAVNKYWNKNWKSIDFLSLLWNANWWKKSIKSNTLDLIKSNLKEENAQLNRQSWSVDSIIVEIINNNFIYDWIEEYYVTNVDIDKYKKWEYLSKSDIFADYFTYYEKVDNKQESNYRKEISIDELHGKYTECLWEKKEREQQWEIIQNVALMLNWNSGYKLWGIEAWTWVWKTYWYLIPSMTFLEKNPTHKIFISTYTKVLENQLLGKDIKNISSHFKWVNFKQLKASSEAIDLNILPLRSKEINLYLIIIRIRINRWNYYISDIPYWIIKPLNSIIQKYLYRYENWGGKDNYNFFYWFKGKYDHDIHDNNLFVVNHSFLLSHFSWYSKDNLTGYFSKWMANSPSYSYHIILDEWHNIETVVRDYFTYKYDLTTFKKILEFIDYESTWSSNSFFPLFLKERDSLVKNNIKSQNLDKESVQNLEQDFSKEDQLIFWKIKAFMEIDYITNIIDNMRNQAIYHAWTKEIEKLREKFDIDILSIEKEFMIKHYFENNNNKFAQFLNKLVLLIADIVIYANNQIKRLDHENNYESTVIEKLKNIRRYAKLWKKFLMWWDISSIPFDNNIFLYWPDYESSFIEWEIEFYKCSYVLKNFWFSVIPSKLTKYCSFLQNAEDVTIISATLYFPDDEDNSYVMHEISDNDKYKRFKIVKSPFRYEVQRHITVPDINTEEIFSKKIKFILNRIDELDWRTLILTTNDHDKTEIANALYNEYNKKWIMIRKHEWWQINSKSNQNNIKALIDNPRTILVWSKSYMEWVDIPWDNLKLVVLWKLPFLPPRPFIDFQDNKPFYRKIGKKRVYKYLCGNTFKQAIWRLIRTDKDTWEILILDPRIRDTSGEFFLNFMWNETLYY